MKLLILAFYLCVIVLVEDGSSLPQQPIVDDMFSMFSILFNDDEVKPIQIPILDDSVRNSDHIIIDSLKYDSVTVKNYTLMLSVCKPGLSKKDRLLCGKPCNTCNVTFSEQPGLNIMTYTGLSCENMEDFTTQDDKKLNQFTRQNIIT